jgi:rubrerythrin
MTNQEVLDSLAWAVQAEVSAYVFYLHAMKKVDDEELKEAFRSLAEDEKQHFRIVESQYDALHRSERWITYKDALLVEGLPEIDEKLSEVQEGLMEEIDSVETKRDIIKLGLEKEKKAHEHYRNQLEKVTSPEAKETLEYLAGFELGHMKKLENMLKKHG